MHLKTARTQIDSMGYHGVVYFIDLEMEICGQEFPHYKLSVLTFIAKV